MNRRYYSNLDKIILRSRRKRMIRRWVENGLDIAKFLTVAIVVYGTIYFWWSLLCAVFPEWP